ncbi:hypothetical protein B0H19DRAFT_947758, partial [Mycena capillaripes]
MKRAAANEAILECVSYAEDAGLYDRSFCSDNQADPNGIETGHFPTKNRDPEDIWQEAYEDRRDSYKRNASGTGIPPNPVLSNSQKDRANYPARSLVSDGSALRSALLGDEFPEIRQDIQPVNPEKDVDIEAHIRKWTLNHEQAHAFRIIACHSLEQKPRQLRMLLSGPGGTGKSRVIHALQDFFRMRGQARRFRLAAFTGVAARNINGMTLHAALCINQR